MTRAHERPGRLEDTVKFIVDYRIVHEVSPTFRDIMEACGHGSLQTVQRDLNALVDACRLRWAPGLPPRSTRTILTTDQPGKNQP